MMMKNEFDFQSLKKKIEFATKKCLMENKEKYGSDICAFALISDDGAMTVVPFTNTHTHLKKMQLEDLAYEDDYEFNPSEWLTDDGANDEFSEICKILRTEEEKENLDFAKFKNELFETCVEVLQDLRREKAFFEILQKDILVMFDISDTDESEERLIEWFKSTNTVENGKRFEKWMKQDNF